MKTLKIHNKFTLNLHICYVQWYLDVCSSSLWGTVQKIHFIFYFIIFKMVMKCNFSPNVLNCENAPYSSIWWKKIRTVKIPKCFAQYHTTPVILSCKIWPHSNKVSVWVEYLNTTGNINKYIGHFCYICGWLHNNVATSFTKNHTPVAFMAPKQWLWLELVRNMCWEVHSI